MREELRPLEGQLVIVTGRVNNHQHRPQGHYDTCLRDIEVHPFDPARPAISPNPIQLDHLWFLEPPIISKVGSQKIYMGRVSFYTRSDGSLDIGINPIKAMCLNYGVEHILRKGLAMSRDERAEFSAGVFRFLLDEVEQGRAFFWSNQSSTLDFLIDAGKAAKRLRDERELNEAARLSSQMAVIKRRNPVQSTPCIPFL